METKIKQAVIGGLIGTAALTMVIFIAPMMGMPKMNPAAMLAMMMGFPLIAGWVMHFMIGVIFTLMYAFLLYPVVKKITSTIVKGLIFGFAAFIVGQIMMAIMGAVLGGMPKAEGSMMMVVLGGIIGHLVFGVVASLFVKKQVIPAFQ